MSGKEYKSCGWDVESQFFTNIIRFHHQCAMFTMIFLSMLGERNGEGGLGGDWELMAQWFAS